MKIVVLDGHVLNPGDISWASLENLGELVVYEETAKDQILTRSQDCDVLLVNKVRLNEEHARALPSLKLVGLLATGYDNVDVKAFARQRIAVCNVVAYGVEDVAQHAMALLLELCRRTSEHNEAVKSGEWSHLGSWCYWKTAPICLAGKTLGIVGYGAIGACLGRMAHAFGMRVLATNRSQKPAPDYTPFAFVSLPELLAASDVISLHCPLTEQTRGLINGPNLARMRQGAILLNTARGSLVDEGACAEALRSGQLGGFGADVLCEEPPKLDNPLLSAPNTLFTPHMAWATTRARQRIIDLMAENISNFFAGHPSHVVNDVQP
ncbi:MAG: D-2-hydroxyacid dehydrogenase [Desulfovibrio sp.]|nr:D-2-hydroxyacid dehydrogenase [Desulfovibrio sp.]